MTEKKSSYKWILIPNPALKGIDSTKLVPICHNGTPFLTIQCGCGYQMHIHRSQIDRKQAEIIISQCHACGELLEFNRKWLLTAINEAWKKKREG